jgi:hypothetical protein
MVKQTSLEKLEKRLAREGRARLERIKNHDYRDFKIGKLDVKLGDFLVLQTELVLDKDQTQAISEHFKKMIAPLKANFMILTAGAKLGIVRKNKRRSRQHNAAYRIAGAG